jgi:hypothetical protein
LVVELVGVTPPNKKFEMNKKGGETTVKNDLAKLFKSSKAANAERNLSRVHTSARNRRGRVPKGVAKVKAANLPAYRKLMLARVGKMAAGWKNAASTLRGQAARLDYPPQQSWLWQNQGDRASHRGRTFQQVRLLRAKELGRARSKGRNEETVLGHD